MVNRDPDGPEGQSRHSHHSELSGSAGDVVQARDVHGNVYFRAADSPSEPQPRQLPGDIRNFINRLEELDYLNRVLSDDDEPLAARVFVVTGTAGVGKTSLTLHWAHSVRHRFPDGQLYVNLRGYDAGPPVTPDQALDRFLRALGVPSAAIPTELEDRAALYRSLLADRRTLVILDNAANAGQIRPLLPGTAGCLAVATSRSRMSGLVARDGARRLTLDMLPEPDAVALLRAVTAGYRARDDPSELTELARLCARLPLALRIAAERAASRPLMLLNELITDLRDESALWDALTAEDDDEADAVRTVFAWSYRALSDDAARLFRFLGLHPGPEFGVPAASALAGIHPSRARHLLDTLVGAHLLEQSGPGRYQFHDLLRAYATDQVLHQEEPETTLMATQRVLVWYLYSADAALAAVAPLDRHMVLDPPGPDVTPLTFSGRDDAERWYQVERANLVAATRAAADSRLHRIAWQLPAVLCVSYARQNAFSDWITTGLIGRDSARALGDQVGESELLQSLGMAYFQSRRLDEAEDAHRAALTIRQRLGDRFGESVSINALGLLGLRHRRLEDSLTYFRQSMEIAGELGDRRREALLLSNIGETYYELDRLQDAVDLLLQTLTVFRELKDRTYEGNALFTLSMAQREMGRTDEALASIRSALSIAHDQDNRQWEAHWLVELGRIQRARGQPADSLISYQRAAMIQRQIGDLSREAQALDGTGEAYQELDRTEDAIAFHRRAAAVHRELGDHWHLATALDNLATALHRSGDLDGARAHWGEAASLLAQFGDPKAATMRERITELLGQ